MTRTLALTVLTTLAVASFRPASAAPPYLGRNAQYLITDASGKIAPRLEGVGVGRDRVALRPTAPPWFMRARPYYLSGYAGSNYGPDRGRATLPTETGFYAGGMQKSCGHVGACIHGR